MSIWRERICRGVRLPNGTTLHQGENSPLAPKAGIHLPFSCYGHGPMSTRPCRHGEGDTRPCPKPAVHRGIQFLDGNVNQCRVMRASSFLSVIIISLTWHTLQVSRQYQPRLFSPALDVLSTCVRPLSSMSKHYARGRASPSPTDGRSPAVQLPPSPSVMVESWSNPTGGCSPAVQPPSPLSSSRHRCCRPAAIAVVVQPPSSLSSSHHRCCSPAVIVIIVQLSLSSLSSCHCPHCPAATVVVRRQVGHVDWQGYEGHVAPCPRPAWYRGIQSLNSGHQWMLRIVCIIVPKWFNGTTYLTCSKRTFTDIKAVLVSLVSTSHLRCPLLIDVECRHGV
jgi:hypothetical protein